MMESSAIPRAIDGLLALVQAEAGTGGTLEGWLVHDGPMPTMPSAKKVLVIGGTPDGGEPAVDGSQEWATMPGRERNESFSIVCTSLAWSGSTEIKPLRDAAFAGVAAVEQLLRPGITGSDVTLGGSVRFAGVSGPTLYDPMQTSRGAIVRVFFQIECRERLS